MAKVGKAYTSVKDMLREEYPEHPEYAEGFIETYRREEISNTLWMMRTRHGVTQEEIARRMGVSQSKIAKLEDRGDSVRFNDAIAYARALGYDATLQFSESDASKPRHAPKQDASPISGRRFRAKMRPPARKSLVSVG